MKRMIDADKLRERLCDSLDYSAKNKIGWDLGLGIAVEFLDESPTVQQWHRCEDEMPSEDVECLCYDQKTDFFTTGTLYEFYGNHICTKDGLDNFSVTHWMPLPELPKEDE